MLFIIYIPYYMLNRPHSGSRPDASHLDSVLEQKVLDATVDILQKLVNSHIKRICWYRKITLKN